MKKKKIMIIGLLFLLVGCASARHTLNRLQGDLDYFGKELSRYSILLESKDSEKAEKALRESKRLLSAARKASDVGDKLSEKRYLSALVDLMDILERNK